MDRKNYLKITIMKTFEDLEFDMINDTPFMVGKKARMSFDNGYGVSVVSHTYSYGGKKGLYEIAVLDSEGDLTYETPVTNDVIGYLSEKGVSDVMKKVQELTN
jgi:hypothetical protein